MQQARNASSMAGKLREQCEIGWNNLLRDKSLSSELPGDPEAGLGRRVVLVSEDSIFRRRSLFLDLTRVPLGKAPVSLDPVDPRLARAITAIYINRRLKFLKRVDAIVEAS
jgi:hypothetical protein